jgi:Ca2+-dependent lipid-binding protein
MVQAQALHDWNIIWESADLIRDVETFGKQDPYLIFKINGREYHTKIDKNGGKKPTWNQMVDVKVFDVNDECTLECWDSDEKHDTLIGESKFRVS